MILYVILAAITWGYVMHKARHHSLAFMLLACVGFSVFWPVFWMMEAAPDHRLSFARILRQFCAGQTQKKDQAAKCLILLLNLVGTE